MTDRSHSEAWAIDLLVDRRDIVQIFRAVEVADARESMQRCLEDHRCQWSLASVLRIGSLDDLVEVVSRCSLPVFLGVGRGQCRSGLTNFWLEYLDRDSCLIRVGVLDTLDAKGRPENLDVALDFYREFVGEVQPRAAALGEFDGMEFSSGCEFVAFVRRERERGGTAFLRDDA